MFVRSAKNPILLPDKKIDWQSRKVYNPTVLFEDGVYHLFFRAVGAGWLSSLGYGGSTDGESFTIEDIPRLMPASPPEIKGVEDPRLTKVDGVYYLTYTAYDGDCARLSLASSTDLKSWRRHGPMLKGWNYQRAGGFLINWDEARVKSKAKGEWSKAGGIFGEKIDEKYLMLFGDSNIWFAVSPDGASWLAEASPFISKRDGFFDNEHLEMGPPPIKTKEGWLVLYHGIDSSIIYRLGWLLLDLKDPRKILKRSNRPIFEPQADYELAGLIDILPGGMEKMSSLSQARLDKLIKIPENGKMQPRVIFCCGACLVDGVLRIYYGAGDTFICTATAKLEDVLKSE